MKEWLDRKEIKQMIATEGFKVTRGWGISR